MKVEKPSSSRLLKFGVKLLGFGCHRECLGPLSLLGVVVDMQGEGTNVNRQVEIFNGFRRVGHEPKFFNVVQWNRFRDWFARSCIKFFVNTPIADPRFGKPDFQQITGLIGTQLDFHVPHDVFRPSNRGAMHFINGFGEFQPQAGAAGKEIPHHIPHSGDRFGNQS